MLYIAMCVYYFKIIILNMYCIYIVFIASKAVLIDMEVPVISGALRILKLPLSFPVFQILISIFKLFRHVAIKT